MDSPIEVNDDSVKLKPEIMEPEKLYHCLFKEKVILVFKDHQEFLNCFEIEESDIVEKIKQISNDDDLEKLFDEYLKGQDLNN